ncbi:ras-2 [Neoconidiobolus thromboides FSU 785]|nr:ras-2 [Neoconidiobolus thromboides FSU 785]
MASASNSKVRRIAVLGSRAVGKSSLTIQFVENHFVDSYYPTIENTFTKDIKYKGQDFTVEIIDTAGQDEYSILPSQHAIGIHGYVLVYSVTSKSSFELVKIIRDKILNFTGTEWVPLILVGNKKDLQAQRQVSLDEGKELSLSWNCQHLETSAKNNDNISRAFDMMINEIEKSMNPTEEDKKECVIL